MVFSLEIEGGDEKHDSTGKSRNGEVSLNLDLEIRYTPTGNVASIMALV